mmetsp:Transcript_31471/g.92298  ORF Transcript_31471/g.92298 Transcript_31471/m.92298 type:complete len:225 (-) Transcript_31471:339-1013(-)
MEEREGGTGGRHTLSIWMISTTSIPGRSMSRPWEGMWASSRPTSPDIPFESTSPRRYFTARSEERHSAYTATRRRTWSGSNGDALRSSRNSRRRSNKKKNKIGDSNSFTRPLSAREESRLCRQSEKYLKILRLKKMKVPIELVKRVVLRHYRLAITTSLGRLLMREISWCSGTETATQLASSSDDSFITTAGTTSMESNRYRPSSDQRGVKPLRPESHYIFELG